jgi:calcium channel MID1
VAYAVPANPNRFANASLLAAYYDNATQLTYRNFQKVLAQVPCETTSSAQYSLARTCADCDAAYKSWLCSTSIPRCTDFTSTKSWLQPRGLGQPFPNGTFLSAAVLAYANQTAAINGSRNSSIDVFVAPGPYKEVLPCDEICYSLVQSCPASMGFNCPQPGNVAYNISYGTKPLGSGDVNGRNNNITCNYPGVAYFISGSCQVQRPGMGWLGMMMGVMFVVYWL